MSILNNDPLALLLGRIVQAAAFMELGTRKVFLTFLKGNPAYHINRERVSISTVTQWCREMTPNADLNPEEQASLLAVLRNVDVASNERNRCVHDLWYPLAEDEWFRVRWEKITKPSSEPATKTAADMNHVLNLIDAPNEQLGQLVTCLMGSLENWRIRLEGVDHDWATLDGLLAAPVRRAPWRISIERTLNPPTMEEFLAEQGRT